MSANSFRMSTLQSKAATTGFWSAVLAAVFTVAFVVLSFTFAPPEWRGMPAYADAFAPIQMAAFVPCIPLALSILTLMVSLHYYVPEDKRLFTLLSAILSAIYATIICANMYIQLFIVRLNILHGDLEGLALLAQPNLRSLFFALEALGYGFMGLATLCVSPVFTGSKLARWIRWLFVVNGAFGILGIAISPFDKPMIIFAALGAWNVLFPITMVLVSLFFRRARQTRIVQVKHAYRLTQS